MGGPGEITLLLFAWVREAVGHGMERLALPAEVDRVDRLIAWLEGRGPGYAAAFAHPERLRCAVNQRFAGPDTPIGGGDEVAFFPPVTGG